MTFCPSLPTPGAMFADVPADVEGQPFFVASCVACAFMSPGRYQEWNRGMLQQSADIHCGYYDRRVTPVKGCAKFFGTGRR